MNIAWYWLDEGILCGYDAWRVMKARLRQTGYPTQAWLTSTPRGRDQFYRDFEQYPKADHHLIRAATRDNIYLPDDYAESLGYTGAFALQELEGQFVAREGMVYRIGPAHVAPAPPLHELEDIFGGLDWGYRNPFHMIVCGRKGSTVYVIAEYRATEADLDTTIIPAIADRTREYGVTTWYGGADRPENAAKATARLHSDHLSATIHTAETSVLAGIDTVRSYLECAPPRLIIDPGCVNLLAEINDYRYPDPPDNAAQTRAENPTKGNDHALDALRYAIHSHLGKAHTHHIAHFFKLALADRFTLPPPAAPSG